MRKGARGWGGPKAHAFIQKFTFWSPTLPQINPGYEPGYTPPSS